MVVLFRTDEELAERRHRIRKGGQEAEWSDDEEQADEDDEDEDYLCDVGSDVTEVSLRDRGHFTSVKLVRRK